VLEVLVRRLRRKIDDGFEPKLITTLRGADTCSHVRRPVTPLARLRLSSRRGTRGCFLLVLTLLGVGSS